MKKIIALILICAVTALSLAGCENAATTPGTEKITVVLDWTPNTNHTGLYVAEALGFFNDNGLEVEIVQPPEDGAEALVASGRAQFGVSFQENVITALTNETPLPITAVAAILQHNTSGILTLKSKGVNSPKDLEGKSYATWDLPVEKAILKNVVTKDGGDFSKINMIPSTVTDIVAALNTTIDAVWVFYGWDGIAAEVKGLDTNYFAFKDINPVLDFYTPVLIANDNFLKEKPDAAKRFMKALDKAYEYAVGNPETAADMLLAAAPENDSAHIKKSQPYISSQYKADSPVWGIIDSARWQAFSDWLYAEGVVAKQLKDGTGFTNDYLPEK